ncbi:MAG: DivIVA domain-containing protein [Clostridia bacterium]|nr:DivIVA domain-containing protein [Clostridia bacterium]
MQDFSIEKKGYNRDEVQKTVDSLVEDYEVKLSQQKYRIDELKREALEAKEELIKYKSKDKNISGALIAAVETAQEIEKNSKDIYELEIKKLRLLYNKWESFLNEMLLKNPNMKENFDPQIILKGFAQAIDKTIEENFSSMQSVKRSNNEKAREGIQSLLNKMSSSKVGNSNMRPTNYISKPNNFEIKVPNPIKQIKRAERPSLASAEKTKVKNDFLLEEKRLGDVKSIIKPITNITLTKEDDYDNLVDKYLSVNNIESESFANNAYGKQLTKKRKRNAAGYPEPNETGFDLKEALNPTEDLGEIMKAFNFFEDDDNDGKN